MSEELVDLARRVAGWARDGEQVEAYVARGRSTEVKVFEGDVESLSSAESAGVGIRVIVDHKQGFAYAGSLDEQVVAETLDEARDNAEWGTPDDDLGLASADGVAPADLDLWRDELAAFPADQKVALALELERQVRAGDPRIRQVESTYWGDSASESAVATSTGIVSSSARTNCYVSAYAIAGEGADTQTGGGYSVGRAPFEISLADAAADAVDRATRLLGARKPRVGPAHGHARAADHRHPPSESLAGTLNGESVLKGRSLFADRVGEEVSVPTLTLVDDPTDPDAYGASRYDAEGLACRRNVLIEGGDAAGVPLQHLRRPAGGDGVHRLGGACRLQERARRRGPRRRHRPRPARSRPDPGRGRRRAARPVRVRDPLRCQPDQRRFFRRRRRA